MKKNQDLKKSQNCKLFPWETITSDTTELTFVRNVPLHPQISSKSTGSPSHSQSLGVIPIKLLCSAQTATSCPNAVNKLWKITGKNCYKSQVRRRNLQAQDQGQTEDLEAAKATFKLINIVPFQKILIKIPIQSYANSCEKVAIVYPNLARHLRNWMEARGREQFFQSS